MTRTALLLAASLLLTGSAFAQHQTLTLDPAASKVNMTLKTNHDTVNGSFHLQSGTIDFDQSRNGIAGSIVVASASGNTGNDGRDKKMNKDVLKAEQFTSITFAPRAYTGTLAPTGDSTLQVTGVFTLLGTPHDVTVPMQVHIEGDTCTARGHLVIPYVQWGVKDPSFLMFRTEKQVDIDLALTGKIR